MILNWAPQSHLYKLAKTIWTTWISLHATCMADHPPVVPCKTHTDPKWYFGNFDPTSMGISVIPRSGPFYCSPLSTLQNSPLEREQGKKGQSRRDSQEKRNGTSGLGFLIVR